MLFSGRPRHCIRADNPSLQIQEGRADREKFGSHKHKKLNEKAHSTTNDEKKRKKNFMMLSHSYQVTSKKRMSLHQKSRKMRKCVVAALLPSS